MYISCFQTESYSFHLHICWCSLVRILTDSVSVDWNNSKSIPSTLSDLFFPNPYWGIFTLHFRIAGLSSWESSSNISVILLSLLYSLSVYCFHLIFIFSWSNTVLLCLYFSQHSKSRFEFPFHFLNLLVKITCFSLLLFCFISIHCSSSLYLYVIVIEIWCSGFWSCFFQPLLLHFTCL